MRSRSLITLTAVFCGLLLLVSCATPVSKQSLVEDRVNERWKALLSDDLAGAYEFLSPGYRSSVTSVQYQRFLLLNRIRWNNAEFQKKECDETTCKVYVMVGFTVYGAIPGVQSFSSVDQIEESWVLVDGEWYFVPDK